jgi:hypothetical protein
MLAMTESATADSVVQMRLKPQTRKKYCNFTKAFAGWLSQHEIFKDVDDTVEYIEVTDKSLKVSLID